MLVVFNIMRVVFNLIVFTSFVTNFFQKTIYFLTILRRVIIKVSWDTGIVKPLIYEHRHEKSCPQDLRPGKTQTGLLSYRD